MSKPNFQDLFGARFRNGGRGDGKYDCWGLTMEVFRRFGIEIPEFNISCFASQEINDAVESQKINGNWEPLERPEAPCLVLMRTDATKPRDVSHIGTYIGDGKFIHIMLKMGVMTTKLNDFRWSEQITGYYKWTPKTS